MRDFYVEVFDTQIGDCEYDLSKYFKTYKEALSYTKKIFKDVVSKSSKFFLFIYVPKNDGFSDYYHREEWSSGRHDRFLDEDIY